MSKPLNLTELASHVDGMTAALAHHTELTPSHTMCIDDWHEKLHAADAALREDLARLSGRLSTPSGDGIAVSLGGLRAASTSGIAGACRNWLTAAKRRIEAFDCGEHPHPTGSAGHPPRKGEGEGGAR